MLRNTNRDSWMTHLVTWKQETIEISWSPKRRMIDNKVYNGEGETWVYPISRCENRTNEKWSKIFVHEKFTHRTIL